MAGAIPRSRSGDELVRDAFRRRANHAVEQIAMSASLDALARALEAPTDFGAVAWALGHAGSPEPVRLLDPLSDALARGVDERDRLIALAGGLLSASDAGRVLGGISRQAVDKRRRAGQLLAVRVGGDWGYPAAQFGSDGSVPALLPLVLAEGAASGIGGWAMVDLLLAPDETLDGLTPLAALERGAHYEAAIRRLLSAAAADAFG